MNSRPTYRMRMNCGSIRVIPLGHVRKPVSTQQRELMRFAACSASDLCRVRSMPVACHLRPQTPVDQPDQMLGLRAEHFSSLQKKLAISYTRWHACKRGRSVLTSRPSSSALRSSRCALPALSPLRVVLACFSLIELVGSCSATARRPMMSWPSAHVDRQSKKKNTI